MRLAVEDPRVLELLKAWGVPYSWGAGKPRDGATDGWPRGVRDVNEKLDEIRHGVNGSRTRMLAHVALLSRHIARLLPDDLRAQFAAEVAKTEADDAAEAGAKAAEAKVIADYKKAAPR